MTEHKLASKQQIESLTRADWQPLLDLIPEIEKTESFGDYGSLTFNENGVGQLSSSSPEAIVMTFLELVYKIGIVVNFHWSAWDEGREMANDENFDFDTIDVFTKCKIITAIVRSDRFCDGVLLGAFESGIMLALLKSIERQVG